MDFIEEVSNIIEEKREKFIDVSDKIWEFAEPRFNEVKSSELLCKVLREEDFEVTEGLCGIETAFSAACPHLGRSALDAVELMNIGVWKSYGTFCN